MLKWLRQEFPKDEMSPCDGCNKDKRVLYFLDPSNEDIRSDIGFCKPCAKKLITGKLLPNDYGISK